MNTEQKHTPEPWREFRDADSHDIIGPDGMHIATMEPRNGLQPLEEQDADARRIVACVNYCAGIPTKLLEERAVTEWEDSIQRQRDELADALRKLISAVEFEGVKVDQVNAIGKARAALAKVQS